jgi:hypothetical protein
MCSSDVPVLRAQIPKVPIMVCSKTNFNGALIRTCPVFTSKYWPTLWMPVGRMQGLGMEVLARFRLSYQDPGSAWTREKLLSKSGEHALCCTRACRCGARAREPTSRLFGWLAICTLYSGRRR